MCKDFDLDVVFMSDGCQRFDFRKVQLPAKVNPRGLQLFKEFNLSFVVGGELRGGMNLQPLEVIGYEIKQPQILNDDSVNAGID